MLNWVHGVDPEDPDKARRIYEVTREGIQSVFSLIEEHGLNVPHARDGHLDVFTTAASADAAAAAAERFELAGLPIRFVDPSALGDHLGLSGVAGALLDPEGGTLDGVAFLRGMKAVLEKRGTKIYENTPALRITEGRIIEIDTPSGNVKARAIVLATNAYTPHLGYFRSGLVPLHSHVIGTEPRSSEDWRARGWRKVGSFTDDRDRLSYATLSASGRLLFGGGSNSAYDYVYGNGTEMGGASARAARANRAQLLDYLPRLDDIQVTHRWSGPIALTLSRMCTMGVRGSHRNIYFALGYSGHGVTMANLAGTVLTDIYSDADDRWRPLPFYQQKLRYIPPEPFRWLGYQLFTRLTGRSPRTLHSTRET